MAQTVFLGLSGGVDSSVSALRLKEKGYDVVGVYMKNWSRDLPGFTCPWQEDYRDAKRVAVKLGLRFTMFDFETDYQKLVVDYMLDEYKRGHTPNPDIMCNQEIKFRLFSNAAFEAGADLIATGHYAQIKDGRLYRGIDHKKDQTYFLYRVNSDVFEKTLFPVGDITKQQVRRLAEVHELITANKPESMGICFVGNVGIKDFLKQFVATQPGEIIDQNGVVVGEHEGAIFYTIGQRHGLHAGGGLPYYVTGKNMDTNTVFVTTRLDDTKLWTDTLSLTSLHWIRELSEQEAVHVRTRHLGELYEVKDYTPHNSRQSIDVVLNDEIKAVSIGQSAVFYVGEECVGGGIVS